MKKCCQKTHNKIVKKMDKLNAKLQKTKCENIHLRNENAQLKRALEGKPVSWEFGE